MTRLMTTIGKKVPQHVFDDIEKSTKEIKHGNKLGVYEGLASKHGVSLTFVIRCVRTLKKNQSPMTVFSAKKADDDDDDESHMTRKFDVSPQASKVFQQIAEYASCDVRVKKKAIH